MHGITVQQAYAAIARSPVSHMRHECVAFAEAGKGRLDACSLSYSRLYMLDDGHADASNCTVTHCTESGMHRHGIGSIVADACASRNSEIGYRLQGQGSELRLTGCKSNADRTGCWAKMATHAANELQVTSCRSGLFAEEVSDTPYRVCIQAERRLWDYCL